MKNSLESDWARIDALGDEEIDTSDIPPLPEAFFRPACVRMAKQPATVHIDRDLLKWFQS